MNVVLQLDVFFHRPPFLFQCEAAGEGQHPGRGPHFELRQVHARKAQQFRDDDHRQRFGERLDEFNFIAINPGIDQLVDGGTNETFAGLDGAHRQERINQRAVMLVFGQVFTKRRVARPTGLRVQVARLCKLD